MKLRNKRTGEIANINIEFPIMKGDEVIGSYSIYNLAELNDKWEDYEPAEPLIRDEKVRKAVRAWAEANEIGPQDTIRFNAIEHRLSWISTAIEFNEGNALLDLEKENYTIAELCGEEE